MLATSSFDYSHPGVVCKLAEGSYIILGGTSTWRINKASFWIVAD